MRPHRPCNVSELIERQVFRWKQQASYPTDSEAAESYTKSIFGPYITLSRDFGCGALAVADDLARRLGWTVYDRQIIEEVARQSHVFHKVLDSLDEKGQVWIRDWIASLPFMKMITHDEYHHNLVQVITTIARQGEAIIVGRGANFIVPPKYGLRIRMVGGMPERIRYVSEGWKISPDEAHALIIEKDRERSRYIRQHFSRDINDPSAYDRIFNVSVTPREEIATQIVAMLENVLGYRARRATARSETDKVEPHAGRID